MIVRNGRPVAHARMIAAYRNREWAEAALRKCRSLRIEALCTLFKPLPDAAPDRPRDRTPSGWEGATIETLEEIDAVTEVTPGGPPPRHSGMERDQRA